MTHPIPHDIEHLRASLDAVLVPAGFAAAQGHAGGGPGQTGGFVWCAPVEDFARRYPHLPPDSDAIIEAGGLCVDVTVDVLNASGTWRVTDVSLEGTPLWDVLAGSGDLGNASRASSLRDAEVMSCTAQLPGLLKAVFSKAGSY